MSLLEDNTTATIVGRPPRASLWTRLRSDTIHVPQRATGLPGCRPQRPRAPTIPAKPGSGWSECAGTPAAPFHGPLVGARRRVLRWNFHYILRFSCPELRVKN